MSDEGERVRQILEELLRFSEPPMPAEIERASEAIEAVFARLRKNASVRVAQLSDTELHRLEEEVIAEIGRRE